jgi:hypothetical protein
VYYPNKSTTTRLKEKSGRSAAARKRDAALDYPSAEIQSAAIGGALQICWLVKSGH